MAQFGTATTEPTTTDERVQILVEAGLLTEQQARAYVMREIEEIGRMATADIMEIAPTTLDDYVLDAKDKIIEADETLQALEKIREHYERVRDD